jgi:hypothetical protein
MGTRYRSSDEDVIDDDPALQHQAVRARHAVILK